MVVSNKTRKVPAEALRFAEGRFQFAEGEGDDNSFRMVARSGGAVYHWYWGAIYHDLSGMKLTRDRVPIDWCHRDNEILGFANEFKTDENLEAAGELVPFDEKDRASEVLHKGRRGVPYEASINWAGDGIVLEELGPGATAEVNGRTVEGPATIVREWSLRGIAVCPHGYDQNTKTEFKNDGDSDVAVTVLTRGGSKMSETQQTPEKPADEGANRQQFAAELKRYVDRFGAENGTKWLSEGKAYGDALEEFCNGLVAEMAELQKTHEKALAAKDTELTEVREKLASLDRGEDTPLEGDSTTDDNKGKKGLGQFIRMKGA